ncbi:arginine ABC transporter ATP-binding protein [Leucobacter sp. UCD-THU]|uniref:phosphonate ABC transporter ATP-binding protein n=1 Tax=Leucobacter sp. UCD-THU TaxID=1292023 RepID=UPI0003829C9F|nr:phosphonate ABC transporter ATP-binding protein [Leucobacter sp. UCD-THU]EYT56383.1 arginine ABC transporter ATP-binding protein [Leucobacter sp. UCD-THU]
MSSAIPSAAGAATAPRVAGTAVPSIERAPVETAAGAAASALAPHPAPLVSVRDLRVRYTDDGPLILDGASLELFPGETVALLGSSGSGKSTLMKSLTGFAPISGGSVTVSGTDMTRVRRGRLREVRASVGQVFQQFNLVGRLSVLTNVLAGALHGAGPINLVGGFSSAHRRRALALLDRVGIAHKAGAQARELSGGQQQRVAIARALMQSPQLILADEPVASLDPKMSHSVLDLLQQIAREDGIPVLVSLHVLPLALQHSDRIVGLRHGQMVISDRTEDLDADQLALLYDAHDEHLEGGAGTSGRAEVAA